MGSQHARLAGFLTVVAAVLACLAPSAQGAERAGTAAKKAKPVRVSLLTKGQRTLERRGSFRVRVISRRTRRLRVEIRLTGAGRRNVLAARRTLRVKRGKRVITLRARAGSRRLVGQCKLLRATVRVRAGKRRVAQAKRRLRPGTLCGKGPGAPASPGSGSGTGGPGGPTGPTRPVDPGVSTANFDRCDFLDPSVCLYPFPNDHFTVPDAAQATGRRVDFAQDSMPRNRAGKPISAGDYRFSDGFSPGPKIVTKVPGLDSIEAFRATGAPSIDDPKRSLAPNSPVVMIDTVTGQRRLLWSEVDANPKNPADRTLVIRPAANLVEGRRYVVALRFLKRADGTTIEPGRAFQLYRDGVITNDVKVEGRRPKMESIFGTLQGAGIPRRDLYLAWDFTVASAQSTTSRLLSIRDRAFAALGDTRLDDLTVQGEAPAYQLNPDIPDALPDPPGGEVSFEELDGVRDYAPCTAGDPAECEDGEDERIARVVRGSVTVPCYLDAPSCPPQSKFALDPTGRVPQQQPGNVARPNFTCIIPRVAVDPEDAAPARPSLYGHGLFGGQGEIFQGQLKSLANEHNFVFCATDWDGMATRDVPTAFTALQDLSEFPRLIDHVQQGFLHFLYLGRLMIHPEGFGADDAFRPKGESVIDPERLFYDGNSQGGIYGGSLTAIAPDFQRAVLGVPGMNYSLLLRRSVDFDLYANGDFGADSPLGLYDNYPNELERPLILGLIQMLWDRGDPNGYAAHMTSNPLPNTPRHEVLMHVGFGDHQVADVSATMQARTIGARVHTPVLEPGRPRFTDPPYATPDDSFFGVDPLGAPGYSADGSALVFWDIGPLREGEDGELGTAPPPAANLPPREGQDPHESPRRTLAARVQKSAFLRAEGGKVVDVCNGPCFGDEYKGAP